MRRKNNSHQQDIEDLKRQNNLLEAQSMYKIILVQNLFYVIVLVRTLEKAKVSGNYGMESDVKDSSYNETESDTSDMEGTIHQRRSKKLKVANYN